MNHILYNIAVIMLLIGMILLTSYITKAYNKPFYNQNTKCNLDNIEKEPTVDQVYKMRPSNIYKVMFNEPSIWQGYQSY